MTRTPTSVICAVAIGLLAASFTQAVEITPSEKEWVNAPGQEGVQVQVIPHNSTVARTCYVTIWIRNVSEKHARVPHPGKHWTKGLIQLVDADGTPVLADRNCLATHAAELLEVAPSAMRGFSIDVFAQQCCRLDARQLKSGRHTIEFLGCRVPVDVTD